jgi:hypothetical protein
LSRPMRLEAPAAKMTPQMLSERAMGKA